MRKSIVAVTLSIGIIVACVLLYQHSKEMFNAVSTAAGIVGAASAFIALGLYAAQHWEDSSDNEMDELVSKEKHSFNERKKLLRKLKKGKNNLQLISEIEKLLELKKNSKKSPKDSGAHNNLSEVRSNIYKMLPLYWRFFSQLAGVSRVFLIGTLGFFYIAYRSQINKDIVPIIISIVVLMVINLIFKEMCKDARFLKSLSKWYVILVFVSFAVMQLVSFTVGALFAIYYSNAICLALFGKWIKKCTKFFDCLGYVLARWIMVPVVIGMSFVFNKYHIKHFDFSSASTIYALYATITCALVRIVMRTLHLFANGKFARLCSDDGIEDLTSGSILHTISKEYWTADCIQQLIDTIIRDRSVEEIPPSMLSKSSKLETTSA